MCKGSEYSIRLVFLLMIVTCVVNTSQAQSFLVHTYDSHDGLPSTTVNSIAQDSTGDMWFATRAGIVSYDGVVWKIHKVNEDEPLGGFSKIIIDKKGIIWTVTRNSPFILWSFDGKKWKSISVPSGLAESRGGYKSFTLAESGDETSLAFGTSMGLYILNDGHWELFNDKNGLVDSYVNSVASSNGKFYVATNNGISVISGNDIDNDLNKLLGVNKRKITGIAIEEGDPQTIWLTGIEWVGYIENDIFTIISDSVKSIFDYPTRLYTSVLLPDKNSGLYFGSPRKLIYISKHDRILKHIGPENGLVAEGVTSMMIDMEDNFWFASLRGVSKISNLRFESYYKRNGLFDNEVSAITETNDGKMVFGHNGGISVFDDNKILKLVFPSANNVSIQDSRVIDIDIDSDNTIWAAVARMGVAKLESPDKIIWYGEDTGLKGAINSVLVDDLGILWAGGRYGLFRFSEGKFKSYQTGELDDAQIRKIFQGPDNSLYLGTMSRGVYEYKNGKWNQYISASEGIYNRIFSIYFRTNDTILVGTYGGLCELKNGQIVEYENNDLRTSDPVYFMFNDNKDRLWLGTDKGVIRWDGTKSVRYSTRDGLSGQETNRSAGFLDSKGNVWIGTDGGVSKFLNEYDSNVIPVPKVKILKSTVAGTEHDISDENIFAYGENYIAFHYKVTSFYDENNISIRTKLDGLQSEWLIEKSSKIRKKSYSLTPGNYQFSIQAKNEGGEWSEIISSPKFTINAPIWNQWWFYLLIISAVILIIYAMTKYNEERKYAIKLQREVQEQSKELIESNNRLQRAKKLETIGVMAGGIAHDLNNILQPILSYPDLIVLDLPKNHKVREDVLEIKKAAFKASKIVADLLTLAGNGQYELMPLNLNEIILIHINSLTFKNMRNTNSEVKVRIELSQDLKNILGFELHLLNTLSNLISNAFQSITNEGLLIIRSQNVHLKKKRIGFEEIPKGRYVSVDIIDNGSGIKEKNIEKIFDPFFTTKRKSGEGGTGLGLSVVHKMVKAHNGFIDVESSLSEGTRFSIYFPETIISSKSKS